MVRTMVSSVESLVDSSPPERENDKELLGSDDMVIWIGISVAACTVSSK